MSKISRDNAEIFSQPHLMWAEGIENNKPIEQDVVSLLQNEGFIAKNIEIGYDNQRGWWVWICDIEKK